MHKQKQQLAKPLSKAKICQKKNHFCNEKNHKTEGASVPLQLLTKVKVSHSWWQTTMLLFLL